MRYVPADSFSAGNVNTGSWGDGEQAAMFRDVLPEAGSGVRV